MVYVQIIRRHFLAVCGAKAERLLAGADARRATDAGDAAAAAVSCAQDGTPSGAAADLHTARHAEQDGRGDVPQGLGDPLMLACVEASKDKTTADKSSVQLPLTESDAGATSSETDKSRPSVPVPELGKKDVSPGRLQPNTITERGSGHA